MGTKFYLVEMEEKAAETLIRKGRSGASRRTTSTGKLPFADAWKAAKELAGYDDTSPIWLKTHDEVLGMIEDQYLAALEALKTGDMTAFNLASDNATKLKNELTKRRIANDAARAMRK